MTMQQAQKTSKPKSKPKDILKTLRELENIAISRIPLQQKVDQMNLEMLRFIKTESN